MTDLEKLKKLHDTMQALKAKTPDHLLWLAQYKVLVNQLKSRSHKGTQEQLNQAVASLIQEAEEIL